MVESQKRCLSPEMAHNGLSKDLDASTPSMLNMIVINWIVINIQLPYMFQNPRHLLCETMFLSQCFSLFGSLQALDKWDYLSNISMISSNHSDMCTIFYSISTSSSWAQVILITPIASNNNIRIILHSTIIM